MFFCVLHIQMLTTVETMWIIIIVGVRQNVYICGMSKKEINVGSLLSKHKVKAREPFKEKRMRIMHPEKYEDYMSRIPRRDYNGHSIVPAQDYAKAKWCTSNLKLDVEFFTEVEDPEQFRYYMRLLTPPMRFYAIESISYLTPNKLKVCKLK